jgi:hypothetical protein
MTTPTRDTWFGEARALAASARFDAVTWRHHLLPLATQAALLARDPDELRDVFLPTLHELADRWPDEERSNRHKDSLDADHVALYRTLHIKGLNQLNALRNQLPHMPDLRRVVIYNTQPDMIVGLATLPTPHAINGLSIMVSPTAQPLDLRALSWLCHLSMQAYNRPVEIRQLQTRSMTHLTLHNIHIPNAHTLDHALRDAPSMVALTLRQLKLTPDLDALIPSATLKRLSSLALDRCEVDHDGLCRLAATPLPALRTLAIQSGITSHSASAMALARWLPQLERLDLHDNPQLGPEGLAALHAALPPTCRLTTRGWAEELRDDTITLYADTDRAPHTLAELLRVAQRRDIKRLTLHALTPDELGELLACDLPNLHALHLPEHKLRGTHLHDLARSPLAARLTSLDLSGRVENTKWSHDLNGPSWAEGLDALLRQTTALEHLDLSASTYCMDKITKLPTTLRSLRLAKTGADGENTRELYYLLKEIALESLDLAKNSRLGIAALTKLNTLPGIFINATGCWGAAAVQAADMFIYADLGDTRELLDELLRHAPHLPLLHTASLSLYTAVTSEDMTRLRPPNLTNLTLNGFNPDRTYLKALPPGLRTLTLRYQHIDAASLASADLSKLHTLNLPDSPITLDDLTVLLAAIPQRINLNLSKNKQLNSSCADLLLERHRAGLLGQLDLSHNKIGVEAAQRLLAELPHVQLYECWGHALLNAQRLGASCQVKHIDHDDLMELVAWSGLKDLSGLDLSDTPFTDAHAERLASNHDARSMGKLDVTGCPLSLIGWNTLQGLFDLEAAATPSEAARSDTLVLYDCHLSDALWIEVLLTQDLTHVHTLDLGRTDWGPHDLLLRLLESPQLQNLRTFIPNPYIEPSEDDPDPIHRRVAQLLARLQRDD